MDAIARAITPRTKALILNSPNNPTGALYPAEVLRELNSVIREPILVISDAPYRPLRYDGRAAPEIAQLISRLVVTWSWSKAMAISGERSAIWLSRRTRRKLSPCAMRARLPTGLWATSTLRRSGN